MMVRRLVVEESSAGFIYSLTGDASRWRHRATVLVEMVVAATTQVSVEIGR